MKRGMFVFKRLQWRLVCIFIAFAIVLITVVGVVLNFTVQSSYYDTFKKGIESGFSSWLLEKNWDINDMSHISVYDLAYQLNEKPEEKYNFKLISENRSFTIIYNGNEPGVQKIYASSDKYFDKDDRDKLWYMISRSPNLLSVMAGNKVGSNNSLTHANDSAFFDYAVSLKLKEGDFILYFRYDQEDWKNAINSFNKMIFMSLLVAIAVSLVLGFIFSKTITGPISGLMVKAKKIAAGDFEQTLAVKSNDEIGELTKAFNFMGNEIKKMMVEISSQKSKFETILKYMTDGVIAYDLNGKIMHINPAAENLIGKENVIVSFNEFSKKYNLGITVEDVVYIGSIKNGEKTIKFDGKYIKAYFALFTDEEKKVEGIIVVLHDNTEQQKLDDMRREFVSNVSHELNTPLTCIKSYSETLLDGAIEDREITEKFIKVIYSESDRMARLVKDLLLLSSIDNQKNAANGKMKLNTKIVNFEKLVKGCIEKLSIEAKNKGQIIESFTIGEIPEIRGDHDRLEQVVINILSNAHKYTPENGKITVYVGVMFSEVYMKVVDTGIGIPNDEIPHIFERFYRVDKARSREMGGTGLGLSIVKEIVEAHGGTITINSQLGKGTEVTVNLPI